MEEQIYDVIVVGGGPAGMTATLYASRANLKVLMIEKGLPGGQMNNTALVENFIGSPSISGGALSNQMYEHALAFGAEDVMDDVLGIEKLPNDLFRVEGAYAPSYYAKSVIVATGTQNRLLGVPGEEDFSGMGVSYCAICDGPFYRDATVAVVGGGDSALEEAIYLSNLASTVHLLHRRGTFRAKEYLQREVRDIPNIHLHMNTTVNEMLGEHQLEELHLQEGSSRRTLKVEGVFIYVGQVPQTEFLRPFGILDENNFVQVNERFETSIPGLFAIGDILPKNIRQIANAVGDGAVAAQQAASYLQLQR